MWYNLDTSNRKSGSGDVTSIPLPDTKKGGFLMHMYSTPQPSLFPNFDFGPRIEPSEPDEAPMPLIEFLSQHPQYRMSGILQVKDQMRVMDADKLAFLPKILVPAYPYQRSSRGRLNLNNTLTHFQCKTCRRVVRNDLIRFSANGFPKCCRACEAQEFRGRYANGLGDLLKARREALWRYMAPQCMGCKCVYHPAVMHMHHLRDKKGLIAAMVGQLVQTPSIEAALRLIDEASKCIPLCANCHALAHVGMIDVEHCEPLEYDAAAMVELVRAI